MNLYSAIYRPENRRLVSRLSIERVFIVAESIQAAATKLSSTEGKEPVDIRLMGSCVDKNEMIFQDNRRNGPHFLGDCVHETDNELEDELIGVAL